MHIEDSTNIGSTLIAFDYSMAYETLSAANETSTKHTIVLSKEAGFRADTSNSKSRMNIGGGKVYNRNEFRDVHGYQSANTSRPPSVHVDDFANNQE